MIRRAAVILLATGCVAGASGASAPPASASFTSIACGVAGIFSGLAGKACNVAAGPVAGIVKKVLGGSSAAGRVAGAVGLLALAGAVIDGARSALKTTAKLLSETTSPQLRSTWFSSTYWRMTGIAALLTLPFLFAAAIQALLRTDLTLLARAAFGYLPLAALATAIAAPVTMLLLAAADQMSALISAASGHGRSFAPGGEIAGILTAVKGAPFLIFVVGMLATGAALVLWLELVVREAAVYVIVLMLPLVFAAMVWPARRVWAVRAVELLVALVLSKFAIIAVLTLGAGALVQLDHLGIASAMAGVALLMLAGLAPWAVLRLLPLAEVASGAAGALSGELRRARGTDAPLFRSDNSAQPAEADDGAYADTVTSQMRDDHDLLANGTGATTTTGAAGATPTAGGAGATEASAGAGAVVVPQGGAIAAGAVVVPQGGAIAAGNGRPPDRERAPGLERFFQHDDDQIPPLRLDDLSLTPEPDPPIVDHDPLPESQPPQDDAR